ncbi:hypothetical protein Fmac_032164 [Flemingia macrophylla]|uniref:DYW domain-containing protein n=1 Tax=Flemingia macrophylla TaxID=520843 RepID=A0ABD1L4J1_9FABA
MSSHLLTLRPPPSASPISITSPNSKINPTPPLYQRIFIPPHVYRHPSAILLELCTSIKELHQILPLIIKNGFYSEHYFQTKLISLFCRFNSVSEAARVFEPLQPKLHVLYHTMLKGYAKNSSLRDAFQFHARMRRDEVPPVVYDFTYLLQLCGENLDLRRGREVHGMVISNGFQSNLFAMTAVVNLYAKCRQIEDAHKMFDRMPQRDLVCWNTLVAGYAQNGFARRAVQLVLQMQEAGQKPDSITLVSVLPAVADVKALRVGRSIHGYAFRSGFESLVNVSTATLDMYFKCGSVRYARLVFKGMSSRNVVSWNTMIDGYAQNGESEEAFATFMKMLDEGVEPTNVSMMGALHACANLGDLQRGRFVHKLLDQKKHGLNVSVMNSLISMYSKCKRVDIAASVFDNLKQRTIVTWNAMILGYAQNGLVNEALNLFCMMQSHDIKPDSFTLVSVITALADLSVTRQAKWIHGLAIRTLMDKNVFVCTALVDTYAKCGAIETARKLFDMMQERHVITWNAMIDGYGTHGHGKEALDLFNEMQKGSVKPNEITFLSVISACSHSGLVEEGLYYFESMKEIYGLEPAMDHYGAMVDLLGRAGRLDDAWKFIQEMPVKPGITVLGAMLGACKIHKNVVLGEKAADKLFELDPDDGGYYALLANIYASASMWDKVARVRTAMEKKGIQKTPGCSLVELRNEVHTFYSGSTNHPQSKRLYAYLETLGDEIKAAGYVPDTNSIHDVEEDVKEQLLSSHSERLAIAFGLLNTSRDTTIHIRKNLRVCGDCHEATKYISLVTGREIIVRDLRSGELVVSHDKPIQLFESYKGKLLSWGILHHASIGCLMPLSSMHPEENLRNEAVLEGFLQAGLEEAHENQMSDAEVESCVVINEILNFYPVQTRKPIVAFLYLTRGSLPFERLWHMFFQTISSSKLGDLSLCSCRARPEVSSCKAQGHFRIGNNSIVLLLNMQSVYNMYLCSMLINMYTSCNAIGPPRRVFGKIDDLCCAWNSQPNDALAMFRKFYQSGFNPTEVPCLLHFYMYAKRGSLDAVVCLFKDYCYSCNTWAGLPSHIIVGRNEAGESAA